jgi:hypothetical protein
MLKAYVAPYVAGLHDGEGYVFIHNHNDYMGLRIGITNNNFKVLQFVKKHFGGKIYAHSRQSVKHCLGYEWVLTNQRARFFIETILPFSIIKRSRLTLGLKFLDFKLCKDRLLLTPHPSRKGLIIWKKRKTVKNRELKYRERMMFMNRRGPK